MKRFIFGIIAFVICLMVVGAFWNLDTRKEHGYDNYQKEMAKREQRIKELEDSINSMQETLDFYREAVMWLRKADYQKELAKREQRIKELEDSINSMQETLDFYREAVMWLRKADDKELQKNIEFIRNIPTKMIP